MSLLPPHAYNILSTQLIVAPPGGFLGTPGGKIAMNNPKHPLAHLAEIPSKTVVASWINLLKTVSLQGL